MESGENITGQIGDEMKFETVLNAFVQIKYEMARTGFYGAYSSVNKQVYRMRKFRARLLRHDEKQRERINELCALLANALDVMLADEVKIARLTARIAELENELKAKASRFTDFIDK